MKYLGIDLHSNNFTCCFIDLGGNREKITFKIDDESMQSFINILDHETYAMVEASTNTFKFVELIRDYVKEVYVANTYKLRLISMANKKTDKIDAEKLAVFLKMQVSSGEDIINPVHIPSQTIQDLRSLFCTYNLIKRNIGAIKNRIHSILKQNLKPFTKQYIFGKKNREEIRNIELPEVSKYQMNFLFDQLEMYEKGKDEIEKQIYLVGSEYIKDIDILTSMIGVSVLTALAVIADIETVERFPNSKHFTSYLRSAPGVESSNESATPKGTNKFGRKLSITLLSQSLNHFRDNNPKIKNWYDRKSPYHPRKGKLRMAVCRKVFAEMYQMLKKNEYHYFRNEKLHKKKMDGYYKFLSENGFVFHKSA